MAPSAYNLGVAVGWKRFALSGDIARVETDVLPLSRQSAEVGVSYAGNRWNTRVEVGADRALGDRARLAGNDESYSLGLDGAYKLTRNIDLTGGVRYRMQRDRIDPTVDQRRDSQAVYIGTAFRF
ncbi:MAG: porin [Sphingomonas fennica]